MFIAAKNFINISDEELINELDKYINAIYSGLRNIDYDSFDKLRCELIFRGLLKLPIANQ